MFIKCLPRCVIQCVTLTLSFILYVWCGFQSAYPMLGTFLCPEQRFSWWRYHMETFSALMTFCKGNTSVTGGFPSQRPVTRSFDVFFDLRRNKRLRKQWRRRWFETLLRSLWRHCNVKLVWFLIVGRKMPKPRDCALEFFITLYIVAGGSTAKIQRHRPI